MYFHISAQVGTTSSQCQLEKAGFMVSLWAKFLLLQVAGNDDGVTSFQMDIKVVYHSFLSNSFFPSFS